MKTYLPGEVIARRVYSAYGECDESTYEEQRYFIEGRDLGEVLSDLQNEVLVFVADTDRVVTVRLTVEAGPEDAVDETDVSGVARFIGVGLLNEGEKKQAGVKKFSVSETGVVFEGSPRSYYVTQENGKDVNLQALFMQNLAIAPSPGASRAERSCSGRSSTIYENGSSIGTLFIAQTRHVVERSNPFV
jgi:hypothetical protein